MAELGLQVATEGNSMNHFLTEMRARREARAAGVTNERVFPTLDQAGPMQETWETQTAAELAAVRSELEINYID